jgi:hypothetical protein
VLTGNFVVGRKDFSLKLKHHPFAPIELSAMEHFDIIQTGGEKIGAAKVVLCGIVVGFCGKMSFIFR